MREVFQRAIGDPLDLTAEAAAAAVLYGGSTEFPFQYDDHHSVVRNPAVRSLANVVYQGHAGGLPVDDLWRVGQVATAGRIDTDLEHLRAMRKLLWDGIGDLERAHPKICSGPCAPGGCSYPSDYRPSPARPRKTGRPTQ